MKLVREGTWEIKHAPGTDFPFLIVYTSNVGREVVIDGFNTVENATRGLNEIFAQLSDRQQVFVA